MYLWAAVVPSLAIFTEKWVVYKSATSSCFPRTMRSRCDFFRGKSFGHTNTQMPSEVDARDFFFPLLKSRDEEERNRRGKDGGRE